MSDTTVKKLDTRFKPGAEWTGNRLGRPKGSRHKLDADFVAALSRHFSEEGYQAIEAVYKTDPTAYLNVITKVLPKQLEVKDTTYEDLSDEELRAELDRIRALAAQLFGAKQGLIEGTRKARREKAPRGELN